MPLRALLPLLAALLLAACAAAPKSNAPDGPGLETLKLWMAGDFDNTPALADPARAAIEEHFPIQVHLRPLPGIPDALYIEQATIARPQSPYRQRVYLLRRDGDTYVSEVWTLRDPARFVNAHAKPELLAAITTADIEHKDGCDVVLRWDGERFIGGTVGTGCESTMGGAAYATADVTVHANGFSSLDRGYNAAGEQVWGAEKLAYEFTRRPE